jgi:hypothetical protein
MASPALPSRASSVLRKPPQDEKMRRKVKSQLIADFGEITKRKEEASSAYICLADLKACWERDWSRIRHLINPENLTDARISMIKEKMMVIVSILILIGADQCLSEFGSRFFVDGATEPKLIDDHLPLDSDRIDFFPGEPERMEQFWEKQYKFVPQVIKVFTEVQKTQEIDHRLRLPFENIISKYGQGAFSQVDLVTVSRGYLEFIEQDRKLVNTQVSYFSSVLLML